MIKFNLSNYINIKFIQQTFNAFKDLTGVEMAFAVQRFLQDEDTYSCAFCKDIIKASPKGRTLCNDAFKMYVKEIKKQDKILEFHCHAGLVDIIIPIRINGQVETFIVAGQFLDKKHDFEYAKKHAKELGIDEHEYLKYYKKVRYINPSKKKALIIFAERVANLVSETATERYNASFQKNQSLVYHYITEAINSQASIEEILSIASQEISNLFNLCMVKFFNFNTESNLYNVLTSHKDGKKTNNSVSFDKKVLSGDTKLWISQIVKDLEKASFKFYDITTNNEILNEAKKYYKTNETTSLMTVKINTTHKTSTILAMLCNETSKKVLEKNVKFFTKLAKILSATLKYHIVFKDLCKQAIQEKTRWDSLPYPICIKTLNGGLKKVNNAFYEYFNLDKKIIIKTFNLLPPDVMKKLKEDDKLIINKEKDSIVEEFTQNGKNIKVHVRPILDNQKNVESILYMIIH